LLRQQSGLSAKAIGAAGVLALVAPDVVALVLSAFRIFVPGGVPQAVASLVGVQIRRQAVAVSMIAGPITSLVLARGAPGLQETPADPVLWGLLVAAGLILAGRVRPLPGLTEE
jgi:hypothetical protein